MTKQCHPIQKFPVGSGKQETVRLTHDGKIRLLNYVRTVLVMIDKDNKRTVKEIRVSYGSNRTITEALHLAMRRRIKFIKDHPEVFRMERNRRMLEKERNVVEYE